MLPPLDLDTLELDSGAHVTPEDGMCLMEAVAFTAGEKHDDAPMCVSPLLSIFGRHLNDLLDANRRQQLVPLIPLLIHTKGDDRDPARRWMIVDHLVRVHLPKWLAAADYLGHAVQIQDYPKIVGPDSARSAQDRLIDSGIGQRVSESWEGTARTMAVSVHSHVTGQAHRSTTLYSGAGFLLPRVDYITHPSGRLLADAAVKIAQTAAKITFLRDSNTHRDMMHKHLIDLYYRMVTYGLPKCATCDGGGQQTTPSTIPGFNEAKVCPTCRGTGVVKS